MKDLISKLKKEFLGDLESQNKNFNELAEIILENIAIQKGNDLYIPREIEFYLYSSKHQDIITYPRNSCGGEWFFHPSCVDITFESNVDIRPNSKGVDMPYLTDDAFFGGILIRAIDKIDKSNGVVIKSFVGPIKVLDELFDQFNAFNKPDNFPSIIDHPYKLEKNGQHKSGSRYNLLRDKKNIEKNSEKKVNDIIKYNYSGPQNTDLNNKLIRCFKHFLNAKYRYTSLYSE